MNQLKILVGEILNSMNMPGCPKSPSLELSISTESLDQLDLSPYQAEIKCNKLLPYADKLDEEADKLFADIKAKLGKCVIYGDVYPGLYRWSSFVHIYIRLYGLRFTKEDHIALVKLFYELITIPGLQPTSLEKFATILMLLLMKEELLSPNDLELPWRPLYNLCWTVYNCTSTDKMDKTMYKYSMSSKNILNNAVQVSKLYFPLSATQEILDEIRPHLYLYNENVDMYLSLLRRFLPVHLPVDHHSIGHELWFHEFMEYWEIQLTDSTYENKMMHIMAKLASENIGYIDWNPYIPIMFSRFLSSMSMPVKYKKLGSDFNPELDGSLIAEWIASVLGDKSDAQIYLEKFLKTVETYFHPANVGMWSYKLYCLWNDLPRFVSIRLYRERYKKESWKIPIPDSYQLTDANIDDFVASMMPITTIAIFNKMSRLSSSSAIQDLAAMRPKVVIPMVLEKLYPLLEDNTTERNKLVSVFSCLSSMLRPLVLGPRHFDKAYAYSEGPTHVLNLLYAALSGIDMNEPDNCFKAINLIKTCLSLVPVVNCSKSKLERNEEDNLICEQTARFEDFFLQFMEKIFALIKSGSHISVRIDNTKAVQMDMFETMANRALSDTFYVLLQQMNDDLFSTALEKLYSFVREETFEVKVAGQMVAMICNVFSMKNGKLVLRAFVPYLTERILSYFEEDHDTVGEHLEDQLLYPLLILKSILDTQGSAILPHLNTLLPVIDKVVMLENHEINKLGCDLLQSLFISLCNFQIICCENNTVDGEEYPYWEDWGNSMDVDSAQLRWYIPGEQELAATEKLFHRYFFPAIDKIQNYINGTISLSRNELQVRLRIILKCLNGCDVILPRWKEEFILSKGCENCTYEFRPYMGIDYKITMPNGDNVKRFVAQVMGNIQEVMLKNIEDNTDCFNLLLEIWKTLSCNPISLMINAIQNRNIMHARKEIVSMRINGDKGLLPSILQKWVHLQHEWREANVMCPLTKTSKDIMLNLFKLSINKYKEIRETAMHVLVVNMEWFQCSREEFVPYVVEILQSDTEANEDAYVGVLSLIGNLNVNLLKNNWQLLLKLVPAVVLAKPTEKLEAIKKLEEIAMHIKLGYSTTNINLKVSDNCVKAAFELWSVGLAPSESQPDKETIKSRLAFAEDLGRENLQAYNDLLEKLISAVLSGNLHWRHHHMATDFIAIIAHPEYLLPTKVVRYFLGALIHDSIDERRLALNMMVQILYQLKRKHPKITIDVPNRDRTLTPGIRADNEWLLYDASNWPRTAEKWDSPCYLHNESIGFYAWPRTLEVYAPYAKQPNLDRKVRQMCEQEKEVDAFFSDAQNISQLIKFLSMEDKKDKDVFSHQRSRMFEGLFRNHGDDHLAHFLPHLHNLVQDTSESSQRCAAEIICGLIRGSKHWPFDKTKSMWDELLPIIRLVLDNASMESMTDWLTCFTHAMKNRDPNRLFWMIEFIRDEALKSDRGKSTINEQTKLGILKQITDHQYWRMSLWLGRLLPDVRSYLYENPLKGVRDNLALILVKIYTSHLFYQRNENRPECPKVSEFINPNQPLLQNLLDESSENGRKFLHTLCSITTEWMVSVTFEGGSFFDLYPLLVQMENSETQYPELAEICRKTIASLATSYLADSIPVALKAINETSKSKSWSERVSTIHFIEVVLFYNMSILWSNEDWMEKIRSIVLRLIEDERVEVREKAAEVLSGMLHCTLITNEKALLDKFMKMAKKKGRSKKNESKIADSSETIRLRHVGVLGMCAFIQAHPYDIPQEIPPIFEHLSAHLNEPDPILTTIRKTLSDFKRTHCDTTAGLQGLAEKLTPEQFEILQDLNVPPSYFS
ncbi:proteasome activator complex subunit 4-like [Copidosoma floridanum]|uniref:proteasome activator complex subunit 4-like n=1 Tax=Copidosoma floridanum TaxID=29053 RepID=UPI0006C9C064|nr:proteasome activator complex subunit 4-like [Copidosoma floridanum]